MNFYPKSFVVRLLICVLGCIIGTNIGMFIRAAFISHTPFVFQVMNGLILPGAIGAVAGFLWRQPEKE